MFKRSVGLIALVLALAATAPPAHAASGKGKAGWAGKADSEVQKLVKAGKKTRVIITYRPGRRSRIAGALKGLSHRYLAESAKGSTMTLELPAKVVERLAEHEDMFRISVDAPMGTSQLAGLLSNTANAVGQTLGGLTSTTSDPENPYAGSAAYDGQSLRRSLGLRSTDVGRDVGVAIIDSGIAPTPDLEGRISAFYDFTLGSTAVATAPSDGYGHGTHIAGLIAGSGKQSSGKYVGVATAARLIGLKVLDANGGGYTTDVIEAVEFATENRAALGIDVINMSLGHPIFEPAATDPLVQAVERATRAGIVVVISAGNMGMNRTTGEIGYAGITSPGNAPSALTVGSARHRSTASRLDDEVSPFSSRGPTWYDGRLKPDVIAPGQALIATMDPGAKLAQDPARHADIAGYIKLSGTSMAAGVASGIVANVIDAKRRDDPGAVLTANTVKAVLQFTAIKVTDPDPATPAGLEQGAGSINALGAIELAEAVNPRALLKTPWLKKGVAMTTTIAGTALSWGQHIVWGDHVVWGDTALWNLDAWANHIVWGDTLDHIVWGDNFLPDVNLVLASFAGWSDHIVWGDHVVWGDSDSVVWGESLDHVVWGDSALGAFNE